MGKPNLVNDKFFLEKVNSGVLKVTKSGKVFNLITGKRIGSKIGTNGYYNIGMKYRKKVRHITVHRLVFLVYGRKLLVTEIINHKDGIKTNNKFLNLEVTTYAGNMQHAYDIGLVDKEKISLTLKGKYMGHRHVQSVFTKPTIKKD